MVIRAITSTKKVRNQKWVFLESFVLTALIFGMGVALGFFIESWRMDNLKEIYTNAEIDLLDLKLQGELFESLGVDCKIAIQENIAFADRVFEEAKMLDRYEEAQRLSEALTIQHKKYDLLRVTFWVNSMKIKEKCDADYRNVIYFYQYIEPSLEKKAKQAVFSKMLEELKIEKGSEIMLIPIAGDINSTSIELLRNMYGIDELPTILIDEKIKITEINDFSELLELVG